MKKFVLSAVILVTILIPLTSGVIEAKTKIEKQGNNWYFTHTNGICRYNANPEAGQDHYTYADVYTNKDLGEEPGDDNVYNTHCLGSGGKNCRVDYNVCKGLKGSFGQEIYSAAYEYNSLNMMSDYIETQVSIGVLTGHAEFNELRGDGVRIFRVANWSISPTNGALQNTFTISAIWEEEID